MLRFSLTVRPEPAGSGCNRPDETATTPSKPGGTRPCACSRSSDSVSSSCLVCGPTASARRTDGDPSSILTWLHACWFVHAHKIDLFKAERQSGALEKLPHCVGSPGVLTALTVLLLEKSS